MQSDLPILLQRLRDSRGAPIEITELVRGLKGIKIPLNRMLAQGDLVPAHDGVEHSLDGGSQKVQSYIYTRCRPVKATPFTIFGV